MRTDLPATWFRLYAEFATDPKVQMLSEADQRRFMMLMCLRCSNGDVTLHDSEVAFQLRISEDEYAKTKKTLLDKGLIGTDNQPTKWKSRQFDSDSSNTRVSKHRMLRKEKQSTACNVTVTPAKRYSNALETETETETETERKRERERASPSGSRLPPDWQLPSEWAKWAAKTRPDMDPAETALRFADYWHSVPGAKGRKANWLATWRNWVRSENPARGGAQIMSFAERDEMAKRRQWEEMTGRKWPDGYDHDAVHASGAKPLEIAS